MPKQKTNWIIDAALFAGFLMAFFLDWTGLEWHQWLGITLGGMALYHLVIHWRWVTAVLSRFRGRTRSQNRLYFLLDGSILTGFLTIGISSSAMSW